MLFRDMRFVSVFVQVECHSVISLFAKMSINDCFLSWALTLASNFNACTYKVIGHGSTHYLFSCMYSKALGTFGTEARLKCATTNSKYGFSS